MSKIFSSLEAFYQDKPARRSSGEADYGVWWTEAGKNYPKWRVSYIHDTGEVYALQLIDGGKVERLGWIQPDDAEIYYQTLEGILAGWAEVIWRPGSLDWVRKRVGDHCIASNVEDYQKHLASGAEPNW